jgi:hypothetical protein
MGDHIGRRRGGRNCELYNLFQLKKMRGRDAGASRADIERFGQFNET